MNLPHVEIRIDPPLGKVLGNSALLLQCLSNLMGNAAKFVAPGEKAKIWIWSEKIDSDIRVNVQDTGIGIPFGLREKIFHIFERVHAQQGYEGTGIGLAVVKKAVQRMNGQLGVESEVGKGSRFWFQLPAA